MSLVQAIDELLAHVQEGKTLVHDSPERQRFDELDREVYTEACRLELESKLPQEEGLGLTNLPGGSCTDGNYVPMHLSTWQSRLIVVRSLAEKSASGDEKTTRTGRPRKGESDKDTLVIAALARHHKYESDGSIGNYEPASVRGLAKQGSRLTTAAVSRFFKKQFGKEGYKGYVAACTAEKIGRLLAAWQHEVPEGVADLFAEEYGRGHCDSE